MFGYPTGVGALIAKKSFLAKLRRPWFAGGNVDVVQVPGTIVTMSHELHEQFEVSGLCHGNAHSNPPLSGWHHKLFESSCSHRRSQIPFRLSTLPPPPTFVSHALHIDIALGIATQFYFYS
jgi:hypothetical protein